MPPKIVSDTFEALEQLGGQVKQGVQQAPKKILEQGVKNLETGFLGRGNQPSDQKEGEPPKSLEGEQITKVESAANQMAASRYREIQAQIKAFQDRRMKELPKSTTGVAGYSQDRMIKQLEEQGKPEKERESVKKKKEQESLEVFRERRKSEAKYGAG